MARTYHICVRRRNRVEYTGPRSGAALEPGAVLCVMGMMVRTVVRAVVIVVMRVVVATMLRGSQRRAGKHHQEQYGG